MPKTISLGKLNTVATQARKDHKCSNCGRKIPKGEYYQSNTSYYSRSHTIGTHHGHGGVMSSKICLKCAFRKKLDNEAVKIDMFEKPRPTEAEVALKLCAITGLNITYCSNRGFDFENEEKFFEIVNRYC